MRRRGGGGRDPGKIIRFAFTRLGSFKIKGNVEITMNCVLLWVQWRIIEKRNIIILCLEELNFLLIDGISF